MIIIHGGDGTVNEVVNGLLGKPSAPNPAERVPAIAVVPGGSANVFACFLGISPDPPSKRPTNWSTFSVNTVAAVISDESG